MLNKQFSPNVMHYVVPVSLFQRNFSSSNLIKAIFKTVLKEATGQIWPEFKGNYKNIGGSTSLGKLTTAAQFSLQQL